MLCDYIIEDCDFGHIYIISNTRAVRYTFRPAKDGTALGGLRVTVPVHYDLKDVALSINKMRQELLAMIERSKQPAASQGTAHHIDWDFRIETECLHICLQKGMGSKYMLHRVAAQIVKDQAGEDVVMKPALLEIYSPPDCNFDSEATQKFLERAIVQGIRNHAQVQLVPRLQVYQKRYGIQLHEIKINSSKGRWGSCTLHKERSLLGQKKVYNINLSLFTLLLPLRLQKLVLLHELTHTLHMDHSPAFHAQLDTWLGGKEKELEQELKRYSTTIFSFVKDISSGGKY